MLNQLTLRHELHNMMANWRQRNSVLIRPGSDLEQTLLFSVTTWAVTKLMEQYALAVQNRYEFARIEVERAGAEQWHTANSKGPPVHVDLDDLTKPCCSCGWPSQMLLPCCHLIAAELRKGQSTQELASSLLQYVAPRWLIATLTEVWAKSGEITAPVQAQRDVSLLFAPSAPMPATKQMRRVQLTRIMIKLRRVLKKDEIALEDTMPQLISMLESVQLKSSARELQLDELDDVEMKTAADMQPSVDSEDDNEEKEKKEEQDKPLNLNIPHDIVDLPREYSCRGNEPHRTNSKRGRDPLALAPRDAVALTKTTEPAT